MAMRKQEPANARETRRTAAARLERGGGAVTAILAVLVVGVLIFLAIKLLPPFINNYQLQSEVENLSRVATYNRMSETEIRDAVLDSASEIGIELEAQQVAVRKGTGTVDIVVHYEIPVDLLVREMVLTFEPAAGNRNIAAR